MKMVFAPLATVILFAVGAFAVTPLVVDTPVDVVECEPTLIQWSGGTAPFELEIIPGGEPTEPALEDLGEQTGTSFIWVANLPAGTSAGFSVRDSTGAEAFTAAFTISPGSDACLD